MKKYRIDLFRAWLRNYFKHPLENIRQANPIVPNRLYTNFGNVCKAVKYTDAQREFIVKTNMELLESSVIQPDCPSGISPEGLMEMIRSVHGDINSVEDLRKIVGENTDSLPPRCMLCDFHNKGIPCPLYNTLKDGTTVCDTHRYVIIKEAPVHGI